MVAVPGVGPSNPVARSASQVRRVSKVCVVGPAEENREIIQILKVAFLQNNDLI